MKNYTLLTAMLLVCIAPTFAQQKAKADQIQVGNQWAVPNIKIDGKLTEWGTDFKAYNKATKVFYTMANDEKNLYLVLQSVDFTTINKIEAGGITLTLNTANKKSDKDAFTLTFPVTKPGSRGLRVPRPGGRSSTPQTDSIAREQADYAHNRFIAESKEISVLGFKDITDTLISIYNEYSIKPAIGYDAQGAFNYEIAIPLKALGLASTTPTEFTYHLTLNGIVLPPGQGFGGGGGGGGGGRGGRGGNDINYQDLISPTDFWGKYTLATK